MTVIYFKTSHVIVYLQRIRTRHSYPLISKHLMLLFILKDERDELKYMHFKTSYVIVYQQRFLGVQKLILDFKTSYVIVYRLCKCMGVTKQNNSFTLASGCENEMTTDLPSLKYQIPLEVIFQSTSLSL